MGVFGKPLDRNGDKRGIIAIKNDVAEGVIHRVVMPVTGVYRLGNIRLEGKVIFYIIALTGKGVFVGRYQHLAKVNGDKKYGEGGHYQRSL